MGSFSNFKNMRGKAEAIPASTRLLFPLYKGGKGDLAVSPHHKKPLYSDYPRPHPITHHQMRTIMKLHPTRTFRPFLRILTLGLLFLYSSFSYGQYFSKTYPLLSGQSNGYISSIQVVNDTIYSICYVGDSVNPAISIVAFEKFDKNGNLISSNPLDTPPLLNILANNNTLIHTNDGGFAYGASIGIDSIQNAIVILKYDRYGNFQWYKKIVSNSSAFQCTVLVQDGLSNYYLTGVIQSVGSSDANMYLTKADSIGNLIYIKPLLHPNYSDVASSLSFNNKGNVIVGGDALSYNISDLSTAKDYMEIYILDTAGNQLNYVLGTDTNGPQAYNILPSNDGGYLIASSYYCYRDPNILKWQGSISKLDSNFSEIWKIDIGPCSQNTFFYAQKLDPDGNYIAVGKWYEEDTVTHINGWIMKYTEQGQVIWSKLYRGITSDGINGDNNVLGSIAFMSDGSILCAGQALNSDDTIPPRQQGWLLHLDTAGCLPDSSSCGIVDGIVAIPQTAVCGMAYPDPASDRIQFDVVLDRPSGYTLHITDLLGQAISDISIPPPSTTTTIDVRSWSPGLYMYRVSSDYGFAATGRFIVSH